MLSRRARQGPVNLSSGRRTARLQALLTLLIACAALMLGNSGSALGAAAASHEAGSDGSGEAAVERIPEGLSSEDWGHLRTLVEEASYAVELVDAREDGARADSFQAGNVRHKMRVAFEPAAFA